MHRPPRGRNNKNHHLPVASWINPQVGVLKLCSLEVVAVAWWLCSFLDDELTPNYEKMR